MLTSEQLTALQAEMRNRVPRKKAPPSVIREKWRLKKRRYRRGIKKFDRILRVMNWHLTRLAAQERRRFAAQLAEAQERHKTRRIVLAALGLNEDGQRMFLRIEQNLSQALVQILGDNHLLDPERETAAVATIKDSLPQF